MDLSTKFARTNGMLPDRFWNQLNGASAQENYTEQRKKMLEQLSAEEDEEVNFTVKFGRK